MILIRLIEFLRARLKTVVRVCGAVLALVALLGAIPGLVDREHAHTPVERIPLLPFWAIFGFLGCVLIILVSKWFGHTGIMTREDYYESDPPPASGARAPHDE
jgi:hypothetical protein